jgi:hypothetical protein
MNSVLVALIVHFIGNSASFDAGNVPFYVVPQKIFSVEGDVPLLLTTSDAFGAAEEKRWQTLVTLSGSPKNAAELCYRAAYKDLARGVAKLNDVERHDLLVKTGGNQAFAVASVRLCNASLKKIDILPLKHPEFATAERAVRQLGYEADVKHIVACKTEACARESMASFGKNMIGIPLEAQR